MTSLTNNSNIQQASPFQWNYDLPDVVQDKLMVVVSKNPFLSTSGLTSCFAICMRGQTKMGMPVLGLCHTSHIVPEKGVLHILRREMIRNGSLEKSIETYVVGGGRFGEEGDTIKIEKELLAMAKTEKISGVLLNLTSSEEEPINIVCTDKKIYVSKTKPLFESSEKNMDAGKDIF